MSRTAVRGGGLAGLLVAALLLTLGAAAARAAFPGVNGNLAFSSDRDGNYEIYSSTSAGATQTDVTQNASSDLFPAWSPNGTKIAFTSFRDNGDGEIYVANADGSNPTRLTTTAGTDAEPAWSPDGSKIAFRSERDGNFEIYTMNADGTNQVNVTNDPGNDDRPAWSPDGGEIAFESDRSGNFDIYTMDADGQKIAFDSTRDGNLEIYSMHADGTSPTRLTSNSSDDSEAAWSPDGSKIAFRSQRDGSAEIYTMNQGGAAQTRVTNDATWDSAPDWQPAATGYPRPKGATPVRISLVPGFQSCASPNRSHGAPLAFGSCAPPVQTSANLTVGSPDANGAAANFVGFMKLGVVAGTPGPPEDSDVTIAASLSDVRCKVQLATCAGGALSDYTGELLARARLRLTDKLNGSSGTEPATVSDFTFPVTIPCAPTTSTATGSLCSISTTANTLTPGAIRDTKRANAEIDQLQVDDGGPDGLASTADNSQFAVEGVFVP
jgi:Tol biopolymer transport system component